LDLKKQILKQIFNSSTQNILIEVFFINKARKQELIESLASCVDIGENSSEHFKKIRKKGKKLSEDQSLKNLEKFFNALGNEDRLKLVKILQEQDRCVCELEVMLDKSQPTISHHIKILEEIGIIRGFKQGRFTHYEVIKNKFKEYTKLIKKVLSFSV
jgi:ArsR family transcriptional regulator